MQWINYYSAGMKVKNKNSKNNYDYNNQLIDTHKIKDVNVTSKTFIKHGEEKVKR